MEETPDAVHGPKNRELTWFVTAWIVAAFAAADFRTPSLANGSTGWLIALAYGICCAQVMLIAIWSVYGPGHPVVRLPWSILFSLAMWYILAIGLELSNRGQPQSAKIFTLGVVLLGSLAALMLPLWFIRRVIGFRMLPPGEDCVPEVKRSRQFQLQHLLIATVVLAVALAPIRFFVPKNGLGDFSLALKYRIMLPAEFFLLLTTVLPCFWIAFLSGRKLWIAGSAWLLGSLALSWVEIVACCLCLGVSEGPDMQLQVSLLNITQGIVVFAVMRAYRILGFRLA